MKIAMVVTLNAIIPYVILRVVNTDAKITAQAISKAPFPRRP